jgi:hypothetical protein
MFPLPPIVAIQAALEVSRRGEVVFNPGYYRGGFETCVTQI